MSRSAAETLLAHPPRCPYCEQPIAWRLWSVDHKVPRARGGADDAENLQFVCLPCNRAKGTLTDAEYRRLLAFFAQEPTIGAQVLPRLKAGAGFIFRRRLTNPARAGMVGR